jgi:hypothetical protein
VSGVTIEFAVATYTTNRDYLPAVAGDRLDCAKFVANRSDVFAETGAGLIAAPKMRVASAMNAPNGGLSALLQT